MSCLASATFSILDAAAMGPAFREAASLQANHACLYRGESEQNLATVAPYLFSFNASTDFGKWLVTSGWGRAWGVHIVTSASSEDTRRHLRKFLIVKTEEGKELYFRFYDPRVLRLILPTFGPQELKELFGPIQQWIVEDEDPSFVLRFQLHNLQLRTLREPVSMSGRKNDFSGPNTLPPSS
ncbi:DUF4123 domain-containing protein [Prosthecobacter sp. SYSU 5D2]|uniref:DUF4123 domain-containing protein n=1 Tax=Prosthecobacter sp. SYSU 5D2 TaxID=3134134 RepID=UPI0031FF44EE